MKAAVIRFPGSNCDQDCHHVLREFGFATDYVWHKESSAAGYDVLVLPGGFSYGDYLRTGAIARFSPVMKSIIEEARRGVLVLGVCNGFQILCESGLLPGALIRNRDLHFICEHVHLRVENTNNAFLSAARKGQVLHVPIAHGEGSYTADEEIVKALTAEERILLRYCDVQGRVTPAANPNGSVDNIAGICNASRNVFGLMPHPERACHTSLGSTDGKIVFQSILASLNQKAAA